MDDQTRQNQVKETFQAFYEEPRTRLEVSEITGIRRANICWYIRELRQRDQVAVVKKGRCPVSHHPAEFLTTNPDLFPDDNQTKLFSTPTKSGVYTQ